MIIKNGLVYLDGEFQKADIKITDGKIERIGIPGEFNDAGSNQGAHEILDANGLYVAPGLIDIHFHGCMGEDFSNGTNEALDAITAYEASVGVTGICPASMTLPSEKIREICKVTAEYSKDRSMQKDGVSTSAPAMPAENKKDDSIPRADILGIHLEGPFISEAKKGAQNPSYIQRGNICEFDKWQEAAEGLIKIISLAPEFSENMDFIEKAADRVRISVAHTTADYETAAKAFSLGATHVTHLFNAMPPLSHRAPGVIGAASDARAEAEIICDGIHVHPSSIRSAFRLFGDDRIILISDSMEATGMPDGRYSLGGLPVNKCGSHATLDDGTLAGSVTNLFDCMRFVVKEAGIPFETALKCASENPAKSIECFDTLGSIEEGKIANLLFIDKDITLKNVILHGTKYSAG